MHVTEKYPIASIEQFADEFIPVETSPSFGRYRLDSRPHSPIEEIDALIEEYAEVDVSDLVLSGIAFQIWDNVKAENSEHEQFCEPYEGDWKLWIIKEINKKTNFIPSFVGLAMTMDGVEEEKLLGYHPTKGELIQPSRNVQYIETWVPPSNPDSLAIQKATRSNIEVNHTLRSGRIPYSAQALDSK